MTIGKFAKNKIIRAAKIRLIPTHEQEILFWKSAGTARWAYNFFLSEQERAYSEYLANGNTGRRFIPEGEIRKYINNVLKKTTHTWLKEVGSNVMKQAVKDANEAMKDFFKGIHGRPRFKSRHKSKVSFYVNYESLTRKQNGFHGEKIGYVRTAQPLPKLAKGTKYSNPHISFDGKHWYLSVGYETEFIAEKLTDEVIGIDLGIKDMAVVANRNGSRTKVYKNINKTKEVRRLKKKLKREQRKASRKLAGNIKAYGAKRKPVWKRPLRDCRNLAKQNDKLRKIHKRLADIRQNYLHQTTTAIVKTKPSQIVIEDLNVRGMMKNRHLARSVAEEKFFEFARQLSYKSEARGIKLVRADRFYPSSKTCHACGRIKQDLKLKDRTYICPSCGKAINRDVNAAINLANYLI